MNKKTKIHSIRILGLRYRTRWLTARCRGRRRWNGGTSSWCATPDAAEPLYGLGNLLLADDSDENDSILSTASPGWPFSHISWRLLLLLLPRCWWCWFDLCVVVDWSSWWRGTISSGSCDALRRSRMWSRSRYDVTRVVMTSRSPRRWLVEPCGRDPAAWRSRWPRNAVSESSIVSRICVYSRHQLSAVGTIMSRRLRCHTETQQTYRMRQKKRGHRLTTVLEKIFISPEWTYPVAKQTEIIN